MEPNDHPMPRARDEGLVIQELPDETLVYDLERHRAHALNQTAAWVWRHCDGKTSVAEMARSLHGDLGVPSEEEAIWLALERLGRAHLLSEKLTVPGNGSSSSRRALIRGLAMAGGLALVTSITAPKAEASGSKCTGAGTCVTMLMCCCICSGGMKSGQNFGCQTTSGCNTNCGNSNSGNCT